MSESNIFWMYTPEKFFCNFEPDNLVLPLIQLPYDQNKIEIKYYSSMSMTSDELAEADYLTNHDNC